MKMLSIDGGGLRGVFALAVLQQLEKEVEKPISALFDVIAGTSTGAIIATSIALKKSMSEVLSEYKKHGKKIFKRQAKIGLFKSMYSDKELRYYLKHSFGELTLYDVQIPLLIPAVDVTHGKPFVHRSNFGFSKNNELSIKLWDAVLSSCSAPVYFPPNNINNKYLSIDGGLWANNPSLVCIIEALHSFKKSIGDIKILSLGTGIQKIDFTKRIDKYWGVREWFPFQFRSMKVTPKLLNLALQLTSESASYYSSHLLGKNYLRINGELGDEITFDDVTSIDKMESLGKEVMKQKLVEVKNFLLS